MEQIVITIDTEASVKVEVKGHAGSGCTELTKQIERLLGETVKDEKTHEYHQQATSQRTHAEHNT